MPPKRNPLNLNPLQLRTLTLLQVLARLPNVGQQRPDGSVAITQFPGAHGDHQEQGRAALGGFCRALRELFGCFLTTKR